MALPAVEKVKRRKVEFVLAAPQAREVFVAGSFNAWSPAGYPMKKNGQGVWRRAIMLPEGTHEYKFLVDGQWVEDPNNDRRCVNSFGTINSIVCVCR